MVTNSGEDEQFPLRPQTVKVIRVFLFFFLGERERNTNLHVITRNDTTIKKFAMLESSNLGGYTTIQWIVLELPANS